VQMARAVTALSAKNMVDLTLDTETIDRSSCSRASRRQRWHHSEKAFAAVVGPVFRSTQRLIETIQRMKRVNTTMP
jgi:hypothetical protein